MSTISFANRGANSGVASRALARAAVAASRAPSLLPVRPWRWQIADDVAELRAQPVAPGRLAPGRLAPGPLAPGPVGHDTRLFVASAGAALHHACVALAGVGAMIEVSRLPDPADPDLYARLVVTGFGQPEPAAVRLQQAIALRQTEAPTVRSSAQPAGASPNARDVAPVAAPVAPPVAPPVVAPEALAVLQSAAQAYGASLIPLGSDRHLLLAAEGDTPWAWLSAGEGYSAVTLAGTAERLVATPVLEAEHLPGWPATGVGSSHDRRYPLLVLAINPVADPRGTRR